ncbi:hypothetical protein AXK11_07565 [Cephaloticoccus primus]|uniref:DNA 3'-5' helicase n=1 Tax=Cephaloticoccus primus TaxID=1548207 RepID=A0A139SKC0_9BACT|nr:UvrD-helicase domain-containing protein [Cephaloticoccus primus]KXU34937.1 hypothetical protein AXK11_07565 [Cephaloticoccus primus]
MNINLTEPHPYLSWAAPVSILAVFIVGKVLVYYYKKIADLNNLKKGTQKIYQKLDQHNDYIKTSLVNSLIDQSLPQVRVASVQEERNKAIKEINKHKDSLNIVYLNKFLKTPNPFFKEGDSLTEEQIKSIIIDDDRNLVIAGAGSGKTRVVVNKIKYLIEHKKVKPSEILLLSFAKASVVDLNQKLGSLCSARTLHSFAYNVVRETSPVSINCVNKIEGIVHDVLQAQLRDPNNLEDFLKFYRNSFNYKSKPLAHYKSIQDLRENLDKKKITYQTNNRFGKIITDRHIKTLKGDWVRSVDEKFIADFLFTHGIEYAYEKPYPHYRDRYLPDFYLPRHNIYLEHLALGENNYPVPIIEDADKYLQGIAWKRNLHRDHNTKLIETTTHLLNKGDSSTYLKTLLDKNGIRVSQLRIDRLSGGYSQFVTSFYDRYQLSGLSLVDLEQRAAEKGEEFTHFYNFISTFIQNLEKLKETQRFLTFSDLLIKARKTYEAGKGQKFKYIILDEFQDTNRLALDLIETIYQSSEGSTLLLVGDDWQSIYSFGGSDPTLLKNYDDKFGATAKTCLTGNFRSSKEIVNLGKDFITKNPDQIPKNIESRTGITHSKVELLCTSNLESSIRNKKTDDSIFILGRYNEDEPKNLIQTLQEQGYGNVKFMTIHKSKGLEADHVYLIFSDSKWGFPSIIQDHPAFNLLKTVEEKYPHAEERRLMYVAISRAKKSFYMVYPAQGQMPNSPFAYELSDIMRQSKQQSNAN